MMDFPIISSEIWLQSEERHKSRVQDWIKDRRKRQSEGEKHPVEDFLFSYYPYRNSWLQRWSPGFGVILGGSEAQKFLSRPNYSQREEGVWLNPIDFPAQRLDGLNWALKILQNTLEREPHFACFGLHEWAMVYRLETLRHSDVPLRMSQAELSTFVESQTIRCSHYDAFRFFTPQARPLNRFQPEKGTQPELEQSGCLHTNMDLYKWAYKFAPWVPAELVAEAFLLARRIREVDMRASPYDLKAYGYDPILIETENGRREYEAHQRGFTQESIPLRTKLLSILKELNHMARSFHGAPGNLKEVQSSQ